MFLKDRINYKLLFVFFYITYTFTFRNFTLLNLGLIYLICLIYILYNKEYIFKMLNLLKNNIIKIPFFIILFMSLMAIFIPLVYGTRDFSFFEKVTSIFRTFFKYIPLIIYFDKHYQNNSVNEFMKYFCLSTCLYLCTTIFFILFPDLKFFWNKIIEDSSFHIILENSNYFTRYGISGYSGYQVSFKFCLSLCFSSYLLIKNEKLTFSNISLYFLIFLGSFCYARIGLLCSFVITFLTVFVLIKRNRSLFKYIFFCLIAFIIILVISYNLNDYLKIWINWAFKPIISFIFEGNFYDRSLSIVLNKMIFLPDVHTLFFGDGLYTIVNEGVSSYYMFTDVGFMRNILFFGLPLTILYYMSIIYPCFRLLKNKTNKNFNFLIILLIITFFIFEIKGEICYRMLPIIIAILSLYLFNIKERVYEHDEN